MLLIIGVGGGDLLVEMRANPITIFDFFDATPRVGFAGQEGDKATGTCLAR